MNNFSKIKLFLTDVDGCLTDGGMYFSANGDELKRFNVYDGMGMVLLQQAGIPCGIITSEKTPIVLLRARKLGLEYLYRGVGRKVDKAQCIYHHPAAEEGTTLPTMTKREAAETICREMGIGMEEVCFVGDDVNDLDLLAAVGFPCCPSNARPEALAIPGIYQIPVAGGDGAIRYMTDLILSNPSNHS